MALVRPGPPPTAPGTQPPAGSGQGWGTGAGYTPPPSSGGTGGYNPYADPYGVANRFPSSLADRYRELMSHVSQGFYANPAANPYYQGATAGTGAHGPYQLGVPPAGYTGPLGGHPQPPIQLVGGGGGGNGTNSSGQNIPVDQPVPVPPVSQPPIPVPPVGGPPAVYPPWWGQPTTPLWQLIMRLRGLY